jgi:DNA-binding XRE family transcriptional regulator
LHWNNVSKADNYLRVENYRFKTCCYSVFTRYFLAVKPLLLQGKSHYLFSFYLMYQLSPERIRIARNIKLIRELRNYDQRYVAAELQVGRSTLSTWENGTTEVKIENLIRLAKILGLDNYRQIIDFDPDELFKQKKE